MDDNAAKIRTGAVFGRIADEYAGELLRWAKSRVSSDEAEDLAQEVMVQLFISVKREGGDIGNLEHFVRKVAHYVWCKRLRKGYGTVTMLPLEDFLPDDEDFAERMALDDEERWRLKLMRGRIARLDATRRELMIAHYLEGAGIRELAARLGMSESAVKWHLFDTRKRLKEEIVTMNNEFVYRPRKLHLAYTGQGVEHPDIFDVNDSLSRLNILLACYAEPKSVGELCDMLGIPAAYIENDLDFLVSREFMKEYNGRYAADVVIEFPEDGRSIHSIYKKHRGLCDRMVDGLLASEDKIRGIGFIGSELPMNRLLWLLIYKCSQELGLPYKYMPPAPIRPDGGKYYPLGFIDEPLESAPDVDVGGWSFNGPMTGDGFSWFGLYSFGSAPAERLVQGWGAEWARLKALTGRILREGLTVERLGEDERLDLASLVEKGFFEVSGDRISPRFCVFTEEQYRRLESEVFRPIAESLEPDIAPLTAELEECCRKLLPARLEHYFALRFNHMLCDFQWLATIFAHQSGRLYTPKEASEGMLLTLMYQY